MDFQPNMSGVSRVGVNAYGFGLGYSFRGSSKDLDTAKGTTDFSDFQFGYQSKNWGIDTVYQNYKGFYTESLTALQVYPDLQFEHYALMGRFALNDSEFSVNGLLDQSDDINNTAGKYYVVGGFHQHRMENSGSLLLQNYAGVNPELENLRKLKATSINLGLGAGKYWVSASHFYIGALLDLVGTYGVYDYESSVSGTAESSSSSYGTLSYNLKVGLGYSGESFKSGLGFTGDITTLRTPGSSYVQSSAARFLYYIRFIF